MGVVRASPNYGKSVGENYGIIAPESAPPGIPELAASALTNSRVRLKIAKAGYLILAIEMRRGGGHWAQIGVSQTAEYIDGLLPLVDGQPELREYRAQGLQKNSRVGAMSKIVSAVTVP